MSDNKPTIAPNSGSGENLKIFQLTTDGIKDKSSKDYGLAIMKYISSTTSFNTGGYYFVRNARFIKNRNYSNGVMDIEAMFRDRFQFNSKPNYIALNFNALQIVNRIISGLVGRWMKRSEKIQVKAIDSLSQISKQKEYEQLEFIVQNRAKMEALQQESGQPLIPQGIPEDQEALNIWRAEMQRSPEEVLAEMGCNDILSSNGWYDVLKEKMLHDSAETFFVGTYVWMDTQGIVHVKIVKPENAIYSYTEQNDLRDTSWRGEAPSIKISELRRQWGKEFNPDNEFALDEEELWKIAQSCKEYEFQSNIGWNDIYYNSFLRPYDEWNIRSIQIEVKTVDSEPFTVTKTNSGTTYTEKGVPTNSNGNQRVKSSTTQNIIGDTNWNIYRGVYLPDTNTLLEWGLKENMITPQDPREIGNAEFSYSYVMPQNYLMRNLAIPEKIEAAVDGMILACLKIQQDIALAIPPGWAIDETAWQSIDYGLGDAGNKVVDQAKLYFQTGKYIYKGIDAEGNRVPVPIQEIANTGFFNHVEAFIKTYQFWYSSLKDELGEDPNLITAAVQPRVTADNVEVSQQQSDNATDQYYRAYVECMKMTSRKCLCLMKDSIKYGSDAYRHIAGQNDLDDRIFSTEIRFLPSDQDIQLFQVMMNQAMQSTPQLVLFVDPFRLTRVAKEDVKLAEMLFRQAQKKFLLWQQQQAQQNQQQTIQGQIQSAQASEQAKGQNMQMEIQMKGNTESMVSKERQKEIILTGIFGIYQKPVPFPQELVSLRDEMIKNIGLPLFAENIANESQLTDAMNELGQQQPPQDEQQQIQQPQQQVAA